MLAFNFVHPLPRELIIVHDEGREIKMILSVCMLLTKASFFACFEAWHHQKQNLIVSKMAVSRFL